jgi:ATP-binding cassette subfamily B protein/ATP-binding cassette subfamily C protein
MTEILRALKTIFGFSKLYAFFQIIYAVLKALGVLTAVFIPRFVIDLLTDRSSTVWLYAAALISLKFLITFLRSLCADYLNKKELNFNDYFKLLLSKQCMNLDYEALEDSNVLNKFKTAEWGINSYGSASALFGNVFDVFSSILVIISLFALFSALNPYILLVLLVLVFLNFFLQTREIKTTVDEYGTHRNRYERLLSFYSGVMFDFKFGKDLRMYNASSLIGGKYHSLLKDYSKILRKTFTRVIVLKWIQSFISSFLMIVPYVYIIYAVFQGGISLGEFMMYVMAMTALTDALGGVSNNIAMLKEANAFLKLFFSFLDMNAKEKRQNAAFEKTPLIEFKNVSFKYPCSEQFVLKDINISISANEKIALVGANGAGKTSFVKLLLGLFKPTQGEILANGIPVKNLAPESYHALFSAVFQDFILLAATIKDNASLGRSYGDEEIKAAFSKVGILELFGKLDTFIYKYDGERGIDLSGGTSQRFAIARALLLDSPFVILDEPTAAIDPVSESKIYEQFSAITENKTSVFVSHRLAGCARCLRIRVFDKGRISEEGSHEELLRRETSLYKAMFEKQAEFYVHSG